jgi:hypothetical protein
VAEQQGSGAVAVVGGSQWQSDWWEEWDAEEEEEVGSLEEEIEKKEKREAALDFALHHLEGDLFTELMDMMG